MPSPTLERLDLSTGALPASRRRPHGRGARAHHGHPVGARAGRASADAPRRAGRDRRRRGDAGSPGWLGALRPRLLAGRALRRGEPEFLGPVRQGRRRARTTASRARQLPRTPPTASTFDEIEDEELTALRLRVRAAPTSGSTHQACSRSASSSTPRSRARAVDRDRRGVEDDEEKDVDVRDERDTRVIGALQRWRFLHRRPGADPGSRLRSPPLRQPNTTTRAPATSTRRSPAPRAEPRDGAFDLSGERVSDDYARRLDSTDRFQPARERHARARRSLRPAHAAPATASWSPRARASPGRSARGVLRLRLGAVTRRASAPTSSWSPTATRTFYPRRARRARRAPATSTASARGAAASRGPPRSRPTARVVDDPRPRYESLFEPFEPFVEGELDRVPGRARERRASDGVELFVHGRRGRGAPSWWLNYGFGARRRSARRPLDARARSTSGTPSTPTWRCALGAHWRPEPRLALSTPAGRRRRSRSASSRFRTTTMRRRRGPAKSRTTKSMTAASPRARSAAGARGDQQRAAPGLSPARRTAVPRLGARSRPPHLLRRRAEPVRPAERRRLRPRVRRRARPPSCATEEIWPGFLASAGISWEF